MIRTVPVNDYGNYGPDRSTLMLRALTRLGVSRGAIRKWIYKQWVKKGYTVVDATIRGINYRLHICENTTDGKVLTSSKVYDGDEINFLASAIENGGDSGSVFVDIGANTGYYSMSLARAGYSKVIAIEPNPPTVSILNFNVQVNDLFSKITVVPVCIGDGEDVPFFCSDGLGTASVFSKYHESDPITVNSMPLLDIINNQDVHQVDGLKIDIEGFEDRCLLPFFLSAPRSLWPSVIVIEDCHNNLWETDILMKMYDLGYRVEKRTRGNQLLRLS